ncbi:unnamed protein product [Blepharisma stoltei]|uniref:Cyclin N-terminal domain-containing protein n=1 Tax=Blepharisma stoltei TaxID=1481888 RepID=A0AAU9KJR2_9CILI|nr:unnamed protein product [Blepharisma stoltei]
MLQAKIIEDLENKAEHLKSEYDLFFDSNDLISYASSLPNDYPTTEKLYKFIYSLYHYHHFGVESCVCMLFYVLKFLKESKIPLFRKTWKKILITAALISQEVTNENYLNNYEFGLIFDNLSDCALYEMKKDYLNVLHLSYEIDEQKYEAVIDGSIINYILIFFIF